MPGLRKSEDSPFLLSRYCGINFGFLRSDGVPVNAVDYLCMLHDDGYQKLIDEGKFQDAYFKWNEYDEAFLNGLEKLVQDHGPKSLREHFVIQVAHNLFLLKKAVAKEAEHTQSPEDLHDQKYLSKQKFVEYQVLPDGSIEVLNTKESDYITPDRPPKRDRPTISPKHPDLQSLLNDIDDEDLHIAVNLSNSFLDLPSDPQVTDTGGNDMSSGQLDATPVTKATPIYGEQNTKTIISPWNGMFSAYNLAHDRINRVDIRMTSPYDVMRTYCEPINANARPVEAESNTLYRRPMYLATRFAAASAIPFGNTAAATGVAITTQISYGPTNAQPARYVAAETLFDTGGSNRERGAWFDYYAAHYKYYTVLACEYEIKVINVSETPGADVLVGCIPTSRVKPPVKAVVDNTTFYARPVDAIAWKGVQWHMCNSDKGQNGINNILTIKGTYKRGQHPDLEIMNDDKREIWNPLGQLPQVPEDLSLVLMKAPSAYAPDAARATVNVFMQLKYIVQFKELEEHLEFPVSAQQFAQWRAPISTWRDSNTTPSTGEVTIKNTNEVAGIQDALLRQEAEANKTNELGQSMDTA